MMSRYLKKHWRTILLICGLIVIGEFLHALFVESIPGVVVVHAPRQGWRYVVLDGRRISGPGQSMCFGPNSYGPSANYGPHNLTIVLANGKTLRTYFFHSDTGVSRTTDVFIDYDPVTDIATLRQTDTNCLTFPGITKTWYEGRVKPEATTETPVTMDNI